MIKEFDTMQINKLRGKELDQLFQAILSLENIEEKATRTIKLRRKLEQAQRLFPVLNAA